MMRHTDREIGATHYTLLASLEVWGKMPFSTISGVIAANAGYPALFGIGTALSIAFTVLVLDPARAATGQRFGEPPRRSGLGLTSPRCRETLRQLTVLAPPFRPGRSSYSQATLWQRLEARSDV